MVDVICHEARELYFYAMNRQPRDNWLQCSIRKLQAFKRSGKLDREAALRLLRNNARDAAKQYCRDHCAKGDDWREIFPDRAREQWARLVLRWITETE